MNLSAADIASRRMAAQLLTSGLRHDNKGLTAGQVVACLGGVQAQDYTGAKWSVGTRLSETTEEKIENAISDGAIVRTWAFRGTLHFLATADVPWLLSLLAPLVIANNQRRYRELELDEATFLQSNRLMQRILKSGDRLCTRSEIYGILGKEGIRTNGQRGYYLLQRAGLSGLLCMGPSQGRETTYRLLPSDEDSNPAMEPDQALAVLADRYFTGHGPAAIRDFCWWSGLPLSQARQALQNASRLQSVTSDGEELWISADQRSIPAAVIERTRISAVFLPAFDEYLLGYKDRRAALDLAFGKMINAGGGMMKPALIINGKVAGIWRQTRRKDRIVISIESFRKLSEEEYRSLDEAAGRYGRFYNSAVELLL